MRQRITFVCAALLAPALAFAQPKTADDYYKDGETQYNLGNFPGAVEAFKKGFELEPVESKKAAYLYNVAQAYRQNKDCGNAQFFYKRYLALKENDTKKPLKPEKRQEIEDRIKELDECAKQQEAIRNKPPDQNLTPGEDPPDGDPKPPGDKVVGVITPPGGDEDEEDGVTKSAANDNPRVITLRLTGGAGRLTAGDLPIPTLATGALFAAYPITVADKLVVEVGAAFTYTRVPFEMAGAPGTNKNASLVAVMANVGAVYQVIPKLHARLELGVGGLFFLGASESPFTDNQETTGALGMAHVRVGISADYAVTPNFVITAAPFAFSYSPPKEGLRKDIESLNEIDFMVGLGYRM